MEEGSVAEKQRALEAFQTRPPTQTPFFVTVLGCSEAIRTDPGMIWPSSSAGGCLARPVPSRPLQRGRTSLAWSSTMTHPAPSLAALPGCPPRGSPRGLRMSSQSVASWGQQWTRPLGLIQLCSWEGTLPPAPDGSRETGCCYREAPAVSVTTMDGDRWGEDR